MPQLNPDPWFIIFMTSWLAYMIILIPKTSKLKMPNQPTAQSIYMKKPQPWNWPLI